MLLIVMVVRHFIIYILMYYLFSHSKSQVTIRREIENENETINCVQTILFIVYVINWAIIDLLHEIKVLIFKEPSEEQIIIIQEITRLLSFCSNLLTTPPPPPPRVILNKDC